MSRKNHKIIDGKLLQTDKKYANLKMKQKERINLWVTEQIHSFYKEHHKMPTRENEFSEVLVLVYKRIEEADIWIPYEEIYNRYMCSRMNRINKIYGQIQKEERMLAVSQVQIEALPVALSVCKVNDYSQVDMNTELCFTAKTEEENSLVYPTSKLPENIIDKEDGWQAMRIKGILDFSYIGIIAGMDEDGRAVVLLPHGVLFRGAAEETIRKYLIQNLNVLDAVIGLPANLFFGTGIPVCVLVLKKERSSNRDNILFIDASNEYETGKNQNILRDVDIDKIIEVYEKREDVEKYAHVTSMEEIEENGFNLNIPRYVDTFEPEEEIDLAEVTKDIKKIQAEIKNIDKELKPYFDELGLEFPFDIGGDF